MGKKKKLQTLKSFGRSWQWFIWSADRNVCQYLTTGIEILSRLKVKVKVKIESHAPVRWTNTVYGIAEPLVILEAYRRTDFASFESTGSMEGRSAWFGMFIWLWIWGRSSDMYVIMLLLFRQTWLRDESRMRYICTLFLIFFFVFSSFEELPHFKNWLHFSDQ